MDMLSSNTEELSATVEKVDAGKEPVNFLDEDFPVFSHRVVKAAQDGRLNAGPLIRLLEDAAVIAQGVAQILQIKRANEVQSIHYGDSDDHSTYEPPMKVGSVYSLLELARVSSSMLASQIEQTATWADEYGVKEASDV